jgi:hypothetical protein
MRLGSAAIAEPGQRFEAREGMALQVYKWLEYKFHHPPIRPKLKDFAVAVLRGSLVEILQWTGYGYAVSGKKGPAGPGRL